MGIDIAVHASPAGGLLHTDGELADKQADYRAAVFSHGDSSVAQGAIDNRPAGLLRLPPLAQQHTAGPTIELGQHRRNMEAQFGTDEPVE